MATTQALIASAYDTYHSEAQAADLMFSKFMKTGVVFNDLNNHPDYLVCISAAAAAMLLDDIIVEFINNFRDSYIIYPILSLLDIDRGEDKECDERAKKIYELSTAKTKQLVCDLLKNLSRSPPIPEERLQRIIQSWQCPFLMQGKG